MELVHEVDVVVEAEAERAFAIAAEDDVAVATRCKCRMPLLAPNVCVHAEHATENGLGLLLVIGRECCS